MAQWLTTGAGHSHKNATVDVVEAVFPCLLVVVVALTDWVIVNIINYLQPQI